MNKGLSKFLTSMPTKVSADEGAPKLPYSATCEVPGCKSLYLGADAKGDNHHACGKTAVTVDDWQGNKRGICAEHYLRGLVKAGRCSNQEMRNTDGSISAVLVAEYQASVGVVA